LLAEGFLERDDESGLFRELAAMVNAVFPP
jgi:hypothetical protein